MAANFDFRTCRYNTDNACDGTTCSGCVMNPSKPVPGCQKIPAESLDVVINDAVEFLEGLYRDKGDFLAAGVSARLQRALENTNAVAS